MGEKLDAISNNWLWQFILLLVSTVCIGGMILLTQSVVANDKVYRDEFTRVRSERQGADEILASRQIAYEKENYETRSKLTAERNQQFTDIKIQLQEIKTSQKFQMDMVQGIRTAVEQHREASDEKYRKGSQER